MTKEELQRIMSVRAPSWQRSLIPVPLEHITPHHSSLTDYIDVSLGYDREAMNLMDDVIMRLNLGAVDVIEGGHYGTVLPYIDQGGHCVGGCVQFTNTETGHVTRCEPLTDFLYSWYAFDYYVNPHVFFGEHLLSGRPIAIVQDEKTAILGMMAEKSIDWLAVGHDRIITDAMVAKLRGRRVVMFTDDFNNDYWKEHYASHFVINDSFVEKDIDSYLIERIKNNLSEKTIAVEVPVSGIIPVQVTAPIKSDKTDSDNQVKLTKQSQEERWHGRNIECHKCHHSHEGINGTFCNKLQRYVEYGKGNCGEERESPPTTG